jgi:thiol-disulfide isomerase/thioredoxin
MTHHRTAPQVRRVRHGLAGLAFALLTACGNDPAGPLSPIEAARGQWVVVNYWAEWCKPCIKEVPELNALGEREGITVLGVNYDGAQGEALSAQVEALGIAFPTLDLDPAAALGVKRPTVLPTTLIIDPEGTLRATLVGPQTEDSLLAATRGSAG